MRSGQLREYLSEDWRDESPTLDEARIAGGVDYSGCGPLVRLVVFSSV